MLSGGEQAEQAFGQESSLLRTWFRYAAGEYAFRDVRHS
jgi:hypothetical protein